MPRTARHAPGGLVYHVLNRANGRLRLFKKDEDFLAFEQVLLLAHKKVPIRILDWCLMGNHWHLVLWPEEDGELTAFMRWLTLTHAQRWKHAHDAVGHGHLYQGRFKSFPIEQDEHLLTVLRYVDRNAVRAKLGPSSRAVAVGKSPCSAEPIASAVPAAKRMAGAPAGAMAGHRERVAGRGRRKADQAGDRKRPPGGRRGMDAADRAVFRSQPHNPPPRQTGGMAESRE